MSQTLKTWQREAIEKGINFIVLYYDKADGLIFCPTNLEHPFRLGGDYNGCLPTTAGGALSYFKFNPRPGSALVDRVEWFLPFLEMMVRGEDFSLEDLHLETRSVRIIKGEFPW